MVVVDASVLIHALLINGAARARLADANLQAPDLQCSVEVMAP